MMDRRQFLLAPAALAAGPDRPNVILVLADDMGFSDAGCYGGEIGTPTLDALARGGMRMTQMYSTARCWPSRSCLMTGYYPQQVGRDPQNGVFPKWARMTPQYFQMAGYRSYHSGKWHVAGKDPVRDARFDRSFLLQNQMSFFVTDERAGNKQYATALVAERALEFLREHEREHAKSPYFLYLCFTAPHFPLHAPPEDIAKQRGKYDAGWDVAREARYARMKKMGIVNSPLPKLDAAYTPPWNLPPEEAKRRIGPGEVSRAVPWSELNQEEREFQAKKMEIHAAMVARMDFEIARVLEQAKKTGDWENTLVIFLSDNGASAEMMIRGDGHDPKAPMGSAMTHLCLGPGWSSAANTPFRLHKYWNHEGGISSPSIWHWPKGIRGKNILRKNVSHFVDMVPTLLEIAGVKPGLEYNGLRAPQFPGKSLVPVIGRDNTVAHDFVYFRHEENRGLRMGNWKIVAAGDGAAWELYEMSEDRGETRNLAAAMPEKVREMAAEWERRDREWREDNARGR
jgi:arylsulfatase